MMPGKIKILLLLVLIFGIVSPVYAQYTENPNNLRIPVTPTDSFIYHMSRGASKQVMETCPSPYIPYSLSLTHGWNLISIPGHVLGGNSFSSIFPSTVFGALTYSPYSHTYTSSSTLSPCEGYWVFAMEDVNISMCLDPIHVCCYNVSGGKDMIGVPYGISHVPSLGSYFGYDPSTSYYVPSNFIGGLGYWMYQHSPTFFCINSTSLYNTSSRIICENRSIIIPEEYQEESWTPIHNYTDDECCGCVEAYNYLVNQGYLISPDWWFDDCWSVGPYSLAYQATLNHSVANMVLAHLNMTCYTNASMSEECMTIPIMKGWNLISLPFRSDTKAFINNDIKVYSYTNGKYIYTKSIEPGKGYYVYSSKEVKISVCGHAVNNISWVLPKSSDYYVGMISENVSAKDVYSQLKNGSMSIYTYDPDKSEYKVISSEDVLTPGRGYLLRYNGSGDTILLYSLLRPLPPVPLCRGQTVRIHINQGINFINIPLSYSGQITMVNGESITPYSYYSYYLNDLFPITGSISNVYPHYGSGSASYDLSLLDPSTTISPHGIYMLDSDHSTYLTYCLENASCSSTAGFGLNTTCSSGDPYAFTMLPIPYTESGSISSSELLNCISSISSDVLYDNNVYDIDPFTTSYVPGSPSFTINDADLYTVSQLYSGRNYFIKVNCSTTWPLWEVAMGIENCLDLCDYECVDTDHGANMYVIGHTYLLEPMSGHISSYFTDYCSDDGLVEYYCNSSGQINSETIDCVEGCSGGSCVHSCEDHDSGLDYITPSYITTEAGDTNDYCNDDYTGLFEQYCSDDGVPLISYVDCTCAENSEGQGYCTTEPEPPPTGCTDWDDLNNTNPLTEYFEGSMASDSSGNHFDTCEDEHTLAEANCGDTGFYYSYFPCEGVDPICIDSPMGGAYCGDYCGNDVCEPEYGEDIYTCSHDCGCNPDVWYEGIETTKEFPINIKVYIHWHYDVMHTFEDNPQYFDVSVTNVAPGDSTPPGVPSGTYKRYHVTMEDVLPGECDMNDFIFDIYVSPYRGDGGPREVYFVKESSSSAAEFEIYSQFHNSVTSYEDMDAVTPSPVSCPVGGPLCEATIWRGANFGVPPGDVRHLEIWQT